MKPKLGLHNGSVAETIGADLTTFSTALSTSLGNIVALAFSSICATCVVPTMTLVTSSRRRHQPSATWLGVRLASLAIFTSSLTAAVHFGSKYRRMSL